MGFGGAAVGWYIPRKVSRSVAGALAVSVPGPRTCGVAGTVVAVGGATAVRRGVVVVVEGAVNGCSRCGGSVGVATWLAVGLVDPASDLLLLAQVGVDGLGGEIVFGHGEVSGRGDRGSLFKGKRMTIRPNKMHRDIVTSMPCRCHIGNLSEYHILRCKYYYPAYSSIVIASLFHLPGRHCRHDEPRLGVAVR